MKALLLIPLVAILAGCASFSDNVFRTEQTAVTLVYGAYVAYTNALPQLNLTADQSNSVKQARLKFAATIGTVDAIRSAYETNSALKPQLQAALATALDQSSNVVWLINYVKSK